MPTAQTLAALGCDELQGYCFSRPLAAEAFALWVQSQVAVPERRRARTAK